MKKEKIVCDLCVVGGGMAGLCAAVSAARSGLKVVLVQDRNVFGGNASSEIRMWIRGAFTDFPQYREGGLVEELALDNMHYNPQMNYSLWDGVLYNKVASEKNVVPLLGTTCIGAECKGEKIEKITAWQLASYVTYEIYADYFADCSGDSILAEFTPAKIMKGRESRAQYSERFAPETADGKTMGNSCLLQLRKTNFPLPECPPFPFEEKIPRSAFENRPVRQDDYSEENFWWLELGGTKDALYDADGIAHDLIALSFAARSQVAEHLQNSGGWTLDWAGFLPGKRESRRYVGDYVLTGNDVENATRFPDEIAYGGWSMDDHEPEGFFAKKPNTHYYLEQPYSIPYRCLYSVNVENLFFAGRNVSTTHMALSSTRVMATCAMLGQAVGFACAIAKRHATTPRGVNGYIDELQTLLLDHDCYLLHTPRKNTLGGFDIPERELDGKKNKRILKIGERLEFTFDKKYCEKIRLVFDSDFARTEEENINIRRYPSLCYNGCEEKQAHTPATLVKDFDVEVKENGVWKKISVVGNFNRLVFVDVQRETEGVAFVGRATHGCDEIRIFSMDVICPPEGKKQEKGEAKRE